MRKIRDGVLARPVEHDRSVWDNNGDEPRLSNVTMDIDELHEGARVQIVL